uniref:Galactosyltransferase C-terminal domain-containing protein n=1 Tax=Arion vulgaris TaxID=1028688 RepID=A0A0B7AIX9_9EUPU
MYTCGDNPRHYAVAMNKFDFQLLYEDYFGGVVGFSTAQYENVNGCSNIYFGWGGEDDDLLVRVRQKNYTMVRYDVKTARYDMISHHRDKGNEENPLRIALLKDAFRRQDSEGLRTTKYRVSKYRQERIYTWINVSLNRSDILQTAPSYTLTLIIMELHKAMLRSSKHNKAKHETKKIIHQKVNPPPSIFLQLHRSHSES